MRPESHVRFGERTPETHSLQDEQGAAVRPHTYVPTWSGFIYLAVVLDDFSRRVIGWAMAAHLGAELVLDVLNMALAQRRSRSVIHYSDQGRRYTAFGGRCGSAWGLFGTPISQAHPLRTCTRWVYATPLQDPLTPMT